MYRQVKKQGQKKLKASTLIETVVGMTLLLIFLFLGMMILANTNKKNNSNVLNRAHIVSEYFMNYTISEKRFFDESFNDAGMKLEKVVDDINENAVVIEINVFNADTVLILTKKQIYKNK